MLKFSLSALLLFQLLACNHPTAEEIARVPEWSKSAVWYQIFPERFCNGDPTNDPTPADLRGSWPHDSLSTWQISPWTSDWFQLQPWEQTNGKGFYYNVQRRRYGGDLQGILDKLDYLQELGINAIYLNPIFESPSLHKYDATCFHHVDDNFGPDPAGDKKLRALEDPANPKTWRWTAADRLFLQLIQECHRKGIRIIIDGVFNHAGMTFWALDDLRIHGPKSKFKDWFTITRWDDPKTPVNEFAYAGWNNVRELPEFKEDENGLLPGPAAHIHAVVRRWMDPNGDGDPADGIDGWRLDVAEKVSPAFWQQFRKWVRAIRSDAILVGEVWWQDWQNNKMFNASPWLQGDQFDAVMNYRFADAVMRAFIDKKNKISISEFNERLAQIRSDYPIASQYALMNLMDSHDVDRLASNIVNPDRSYDHAVNNHDDKTYNPRRATADERVIQKLIAVMKMTYIGAPMIYYGTEAGMWGGDDPDCRKPMVWEEFTYSDEIAMPDGTTRSPDPVHFDRELFGFYQKLIAIRNASPALCLGDFTAVAVDDARELFAFKRRFKNETVLVAFNLSAQEQALSLECTESELWQDLFSGASLPALMGDLQMALPGKSVKIFQARANFVD